MTDAEIIKALECFAIDKDSDELYCVGCAFETKGLCCENCSDGLAKASLDHINRQKAEIERLRTECGNQSTLWSRHYESLFETAKETIKVEAIKEFAERLKEHKYQSSDWSHGEHPFVVEEIDIDNLVKEMEGDMK